MSVKDSIRDMRTRIAEQKKVLRDKVKEVFHSEAAELFKKHPKLQGFRWSQYTPYFNDGDECVFSANTCDFDVKYEGFADGEYDEVYGRDEPSGVGAAVKDITEFLSAFDDDDLKSLFGDHKRVTVEPGGISVDEYSHD